MEVIPHGRLLGIPVLKAPEVMPEACQEAKREDTLINSMTMEMEMFQISYPEVVQDVQAPPMVKIEEQPMVESSSSTSLSTLKSVDVPLYVRTIGKLNEEIDEMTEKERIGTIM